MRISILVPRGAVALSTIEGSMGFFDHLNAALRARGRAAAFQTTLVGMTPEPQTYDRVFTVTPETTIGETEVPDLVIIPAVNGDKEVVIADNAAFLPWIVDQYRAGAEVMSLCVGAFLLAATGLMKGRKIATHWGSTGEFRRLFRDVELVPDAITTDEAGIYSSGGALSFWNLLLYYAEKHTDRETALAVAKTLEIDLDRSRQSDFLIFAGQKDHGDPAVRGAQEHIETHYGTRITVEDLCSLFAVGRRSLERRFKQATGNTVLEYIHRVRVEAAKKEFETGRKTVNEVMYDTGYSDPKAFRTVFQRVAGRSPTEYRARFQRLAAPL
jgi:transcriptional regulator GlxA family with amidase domain